MERYLGLDMHPESCSFCVLEASGEELRRDMVETNGRALSQNLQQLSWRMHLCYEESEWAGWPWEIRLGKAYLVTRFQLLLQTHRLDLPRTADTEILAEELRDYEKRFDERANERYGAFRVGTRDEFVTALGLAVQEDGAPQSSFLREWL